MIDSGGEGAVEPRERGPSGLGVAPGGAGSGPSVGVVSTLLGLVGAIGLFLPGVWILGVEVLVSPSMVFSTLVTNASTAPSVTPSTILD